jgi:HK97 family phage major capsid protein
VNGNTDVFKRDMTEGAPMLPQIGTYNTTGGTFVPTGFFPQLFAALAEHDGLFDPENVTRIDSTNGQPLPVPTASDVENVANLISEAGSQTSGDIYATNHVVLGAYSFSSPRFVVSLEAFQDLQGISVIDLAKRFFADRIARGIGNYLINGTGSAQPTGLLAALAAQTPITAQGSSVNDGGASTGANSLGSQDFSNALAALDEAYASSPKCAWAMNKKTLAAVSGQLDKYGNLLDLVQYDADGNPTIFGIKVVICPSMPSIGASNVSVVLGDFSYFATRIVTDGSSGIKVFTEAPGLAEYGKVSLRTFVRADSNILWTPGDGTSNCPFVQIRHHS